MNQSLAPDEKIKGKSEQKLKNLDEEVASEKDSYSSPNGSNRSNEAYSNSSSSSSG